MRLLQLKAPPNFYAATSHPSAAPVRVSRRLITTSLTSRPPQAERPQSIPTRNALQHTGLARPSIRTMATTSSSALSAAEQNALIESSKRSAAYQAVKEHMDFSYRLIGIGSGSTVVFVVEALKALGKDVTDKMSFFSTGDQSRELIKAAGFRLEYIQDLDGDQQLDVCFDGADEVDEELNLIKGGGACLFQEKLVAIKSKKFVCVAGEWLLSFIYSLCRQECIANAIYQTFAKCPPG